MSIDKIKINNIEFKIEYKYLNTKYTYFRLKDDKIIIKSRYINDKIINDIYKKLENLKLNFLPEYAFTNFMIFGEPSMLDIKDNYKKDFINHLSELLLNYSKERIKYLSNIVNINYDPEIKIKKMKTKYGYLKNNIIYLSLFNIFLPKYLVDYIIVHELLHFKIKGHGKNFNILMRNVYPNYRELENDLKRWTIAIFYNKNIRKIFE